MSKDALRWFARPGATSRGLWLGVALHVAGAAVASPTGQAPVPGDVVPLLEGRDDLLPGNLPEHLRQEWMKAFERTKVAEDVLEDQLRKERELIECQIFGELATELGVASVDDLILDTDMSGPDARFLLSYASRKEPLREFIRNGKDRFLREAPYNPTAVYVRNTRVLSNGVEDARAPTLRRILDVLDDYVAADRSNEAATRKFAAGAPRYLETVAEPAMAELHFAQLDAVRRGDITTAQYERLVSAIRADVADGEGVLSWAAHSLSIGRSWADGNPASPPPLPIFSIRIRAGDGFPEMRFLYTPGHPEGSLRYLSAADSPSSMVLQGISGNATSQYALAWFAARMAPEDFFSLHRETSKFLATPKIELIKVPTTHRPQRFEKAVTAMYASKVRSAIDPWFLGRNLDSSDRQYIPLILQLARSKR